MDLSTPPHLAIKDVPDLLDRSVLLVDDDLPARFAVASTLTDAGAAVRFSVQSLGGEAISPGEAVTGPDGTVQTVLTSGRRTASARVRAELVSNPSIFTQSASVTIIGAPPAQDRFSMAVEFVNVAGRVTRPS